MPTAGVRFIRRDACCKGELTAGRRVVRRGRTGTRGAPLLIDSACIGGYSGLDLLTSSLTGLPSRPGEFHRAPHRTGLKPLDLSGSCHRLKAAAFH